MRFPNFSDLLTSMFNEPHNLLSERAATGITRGAIFAEISMSSLHGLSTEAYLLEACAFLLKTFPCRARVYLLHQLLCIILND